MELGVKIALNAIQLLTTTMEVEDMTMMDYTVIISLGSSRVGLPVQDLTIKLRQQRIKRFRNHCAEIRAAHGLEEAINRFQAAVEFAISPCGGKPFSGLCLISSFPPELEDVKAEIRAILKNAATAREICCI